MRTGKSITLVTVLVFLAILLTAGCSDNGGDDNNDGG